MIPNLRRHRIVNAFWSNLSAAQIGFNERRSSAYVYREWALAKQRGDLPDIKRPDVGLYAGPELRRIFETARAEVAA